MPADPIRLPDPIDDAILRYLLSGKAKTLDQAEEMFLDDSLPEVARLVATIASDDELARHPLMVMMLRRGSRGWEDSLL